jgi:hypothetical protein
MIGHAKCDCVVISTHMVPTGLRRHLADPSPFRQAEKDHIIGVGKREWIDGGIGAGVSHK